MLIHNVLFPESVSALLIKSTLKTPILPKKGAYQSLWRKNIKIDILKFEHEILHTGLLQSLKCVRRVRMPSSIRLKSNNLNGVVKAAFTLSLVCHYLVILKTNQEMKLIMTLLLHPRSHPFQEAETRLFSFSALQFSCSFSFQ